MSSIPTVLTIAGSDSSGCAGIQADLKTFGALGVHGMSVVTCVTAQDTRRVYQTYELTGNQVGLQIEAVLEDIGTNTVKTGMLPSAEIIESVAAHLGRYQVELLVVDPVMRSTGGDSLIQDEAVVVLKERLLPLATIVTPNLPEAEFLVQRRITSEQEIEAAARDILQLGPQAVIIKGGHLPDPECSTDYLFDADGLTLVEGPRIDTQNTHGSGCTFASAIAAYLSQQLELKEAVTQAKRYVTEAIRHSLTLGHGNGPLGHFHA